MEPFAVGFNRGGLRLFVQTSVLFVLVGIGLVCFGLFAALGYSGFRIFNWLGILFGPFFILSGSLLYLQMSVRDRGDQTFSLKSFYEMKKRMTSTTGRRS